MKTILQKTSLWVFLLFVPASAALAQSDAELKARIEKLNLEMVKAAISGDMNQSLKFYTKDVISMPNYEKMLIGIEAVKKSNEEMKKSGWKVVSFNPITLSVISCGDMITEIGTFEIALSMEGMDTPVKDAGKYITLWEKQEDGSLKIKVETWNTDKYPGQEEKK